MARKPPSLAAYDKALAKKLAEGEDGEGDVYRFADVTASGTLLEEGQAETLKGIETVQGEIFNFETLRKDTFTLTEKFTDIGYAFANVEPLTDIDRQNKVVNVDFRIDQGSLITVNRIIISGNEKTLDRVVRRTLKIQEREAFSSSRIRRSRTRRRQPGGRPSARRNR